MPIPTLSRRAALLGGLATTAAAARGAYIPIDTRQGACLVPVSLDGRPARLLLDTGAQLTMLTSTAATRLGLRADPWVSTTLRGAGGLVARRADVDVRTALTGGIQLFQHQPGAGLILPVTSSTLGDADGLLGGDVLRHFTIALDVPGGRVALYPAAPATPAPGAVRLQSLRRTLLLAPVVLDGRSLVALVDTAAAASLVNARGLYKLGLTQAKLAAAAALPLRTVGGTTVARPHRFSSLRIGGLTVAQPVLLAVDVPEAAYDLVLGLDVLGRQPVRLSYLDLTLEFGAAG